jgi:predicted nucleotidyltransferase
MNIHILLSTKERVRILEAVLYGNGPVRVSAVSRETGLSKGLVSKILDILAMEKILNRQGRAYAVNDCPSTRGLKILLNLSSFDADVFRKFPFVKGAGIYGSFAKGENTEGSDIDLWVLVGAADVTALARLTAALREMDDRINPYYLTDAKRERLMREDPLLYPALYYGSIDVWGEGLDAVQLQGLREGGPAEGRRTVAGKGERKPDGR